MSLSLREADRECGRLLRHYENFTVASRLTPRELRRDLTRIYAFCRLTDDLGDEGCRGVVAEQRLREWRAQTESLLRGGAVSHPVLLALSDTVKRRAIPGELLLRLIDANLQDQRVSAYATYEALRRYCSLSADPVGRMVLTLFGVSDAEALRCSDDVCTGLQLANFVQDVSVDAGKGRTYLVQSDIQAHGVVGATRAMAERAALLLQSGRVLERMVRGRLRLQLALYRCGGEAILRAAARQGYDTRTRRPVVTPAARVGVLVRATAALFLPRMAASQTRTAARHG